MARFSSDHCDGPLAWAAPRNIFRAAAELDLVEEGLVRPGDDHLGRLV